MALDSVGPVPPDFGGSTFLVAPVAADETERIQAESAGLQACQTSLQVAFCSHTIMLDGPLVIPDALRDARFAQNPLVTDEPYIRAYAGILVRGPNGHAQGDRP